jgi:hypothetical protein
MKRKKSSNIIILSLIVAVSLYFSVRLLMKLEINNILEYIPILVFIVSVAFLISTILNGESYPRTSVPYNLYNFVHDTVDRMANETNVNNRVPFIIVFI